MTWLILHVFYGVEAYVLEALESSNCMVLTLDAQNLRWIRCC